MYRFSTKVRTVSGAETVIPIDATDCKTAIAIATTHPEVIKNYSDAYSFEVDLNIPTVPISPNTLSATTNATNTSARAGVSIAL